MGISKPLGLLQLVMDRIRRTLYLQKDKPMDPKVRKDSEKMTDIEKMDQGFNGDTFSLNGRDVDF